MNIVKIKFIIITNSNKLSSILKSKKTSNIIIGIFWIEINIIKNFLENNFINLIIHKWNGKIPILIIIIRKISISFFINIYINNIIEEKDLIII
jgi:hypothetical protein